MTMLLLASALTLLIAACDANGDDEAADDVTDGTTEMPADDDAGVDGQDDIAVPEADDDAISSEPGDDAAPADDSEATEPADDTEATAPDDEEFAVPEDDEEFDPEAVDPDDIQPDPNEGMFFDLTVEEANDMTEFEVREPGHIPEMLEFQTIMGMASMDAQLEEEGEMDEDEAATITFAYQQPPEDEMMQGLPVEFMQSTEIDMSEGLTEEAEQEQVTIGDREVTRISIVTEAGDEVLAYVWNEDDVHFSLAALLGGELQESDLEAMIESIPAA
jgi:hypothetical protein